MTESDKKPFVAPVRLTSMIWLPFVLLVVWAAQHYGTPHLRVKYVWSGSRAYPTYHDCQYWGLHSFRLNPPADTCPLFVLARSKDS